MFRVRVHCSCELRAISIPTVARHCRSMALADVALYMWGAALFRRVYNAYLEACYFSFPQFRTQPPREHALKNRTDLSGRDLDQVKKIELHDKLTMLSQFALEMAIYWTLPGFYPSSTVAHDTWERALRLVANHFVLSFGTVIAPLFFTARLHDVHHLSNHPPHLPSHTHNRNTVMSHSAASSLPLSCRDVLDAPYVTHRSVLLATYPFVSSLGKAPFVPKHVRGPLARQRRQCNCWPWICASPDSS